MPDIDTRKHQVTALLIDMSNVIFRLENCVKDAGNVLDRATQLLRAPVRSDAQEPYPAEQHDYYKWFLSYQYCPFCGERVLSQPSGGG